MKSAAVPALSFTWTVRAAPLRSIGLTNSVSKSAVGELRTRKPVPEMKPSGVVLLQVSVSGVTLPPMFTVSLASAAAKPEPPTAENVTVPVPAVGVTASARVNEPLVWRIPAAGAAPELKCRGLLAGSVLPTAWSTPSLMDVMPV